MALNSEDKAEISRMIDARMDERSVHQEARMFLIDEETRRTVARIDTRLDGIDARLDGMDLRFDGIDARLDGMDLRFDGIDGRLGGIEVRLGGLEQTVGGMDVRLGELELTVDGLSGLQRDTNQMVREILDRLADS